MDARTRGAVLAAVGVVLLAATLVGSAAVAPDRGVSGANTDGDGEHRTLVGIQGGGPGWHEYGAVAMVRGDEVVWREDSAGSYFDVTMRPDGTVLAGFMNGDREDCGPYEAPCARTGFRVIDPAAEGGPTVVDGGYSFPVKTQKNSEVHDAEPLPSGGYLVTDMDRERVFVVENGTVTWQWNASSFYQPPADATETDWLHINDVDRIGEGRYLVSVRNANQVLVVERTADGGARVAEVVNVDDDPDEGACADQLVGDDPRCGDTDLLNHQHNPMWLGEDEDGRAAMLVADSDNDRVVELRRAADGEWTVAWSLSSAGGIDLHWPRDADRLPNGNTLVTDTLNKRLVEVNENGTVVWSTTTERIPYEADRLPAGERASGQWYEADRGENSVESGVPGLSLLVVGLKAAFPWLPFWFGELQAGVTVLSTVLVGAGGVVAWRGD
ncbi:MAG: hypothetical protein ABEJ79_01120 [Halolamina sp.]